VKPERWHIHTEIERKFLVTGSEWRQANGVRFSQGYLNHDKERTVRVRAWEKVFLTIKGITKGATRNGLHPPKLDKMC
jgi:CYTH domain-containing protein